MKLRPPMPNFFHGSSHSHPSGTPTPTLQQILDGLVVSGPAIDANAPSGVDLWDNTSGPMTAQVVVDFTGAKQTLFFGMYAADDPKNRAFLLTDNLKPSDVATVSFLDDGKITISGGIKGRSKADGFDGPFGFFVKIPGHFKNESPVFLFTEAELNGGLVKAKVFQGNGETQLKFPGLAPGLFLTNQFLIAFETGNDNGYNDFIVSVSGIVAAPEPALCLLVGASLAALFARRIRGT